MAVDKKKVVLEYVMEYAVLVVDKNPSSRNRLLKVLVDLGVKRHMIYTAGAMHEAEDIIAKNKIGIVLADFVIGGGSGFDLFKMVREKFPLNDKLCLILVTSNISQTAVAKAAEEDVDSFIIKPYTVQSIQESLVATISGKVKPSQYIVKIEIGKKQLIKGDYDKAYKTFEEAVKLHNKPSLALFYLGQTKYLVQEEEEAKSRYNKGLGLNSIHFKCLLGLYDIFKTAQKHEEAYGIVKKVAKYFPANPQRLAEVIRLAVVTQNFSDMEAYYEIFTSLEERDSQLVNYIGAGMYVSGKYFLSNHDTSKALATFDKIAVSCNEFPKFIKGMIYTLTDYGMFQETEKFLSRFASDSIGTDDYEMSHYVSSYGDLKDRTGAIKQGLVLYNKNIRDFNVLKILVESMIQENMSSKAEPMIKELQAKWPERFVEIKLKPQARAA
jgi:CheY-like chemotaxis protein